MDDDMSATKLQSQAQPNRKRDPDHNARNQTATT